MAIIGSAIIAVDTQAKLNSAAIAEEYSASATYNVDDLVTYKGKLYRCKSAIATAEAWNAAHWDEVTVDEIIQESAANALPKNGGTMSGAINMGDNKVTDLANPTADGDAANKKYVDDNYLAKTLKGATNGVAELDGNGKVPSAQLPSYVDDILDGYLYNGKFYAEQAHTTELTAEGGKIYVDKETNKQYRWSGSAYVEVSESLALGETASTAYAGNKGKEAHDLAEAALPKTGGTMTGDIAMGNNKVTGLAAPTADSDAANRKYVDDEINKLTVDSELSDTSEKPVQNKVVKAGIDVVQTNLDKLGFSVDQNGALNQTAGNDTAPVLKDSTGKRIRDAIRNLVGTYDLTDYKSITAAVRNGDGAKIPNGTTFIVPHAVFGNIEFVVRRKNVDKVYNDANRPTLTIQAKHLLSNNGGSTVKTFVYDRREAFASIAQEIPAGTVCKFTATTIDNWTAGVYSFTATNAIAAGSKLVFDNHAWNTGALTTRKVQVFTDPKSTTPLASYSIVAGGDGATLDLGTWGVELNHAHRNAYGSNNEEQSNLLQWLNSTGAMSSVFVPKTKYDMMDGMYASMDGFLGGFPQDFLNCLGLCSVHNLTNDVFESPDSAHAKSTEYTHNAYFWLPSRKEIYGTNENVREDSESQFAYYSDIGTTNADKLMYAKGAASPTTYWLRTPFAGGAVGVRFCYTGDGGALGGNGADGSYGVAPLAILA